MLEAIWDLRNYLGDSLRNQLLDEAFNKDGLLSNILTLFNIL
jgi:hypothetical protein